MRYKTLISIMISSFFCTLSCQSYVNNLMYPVIRLSTKCHAASIENDELITIRDLEEYSRPWGVQLSVTNTLSYFKVTATKLNSSSQELETVGYASGFVWGELLHLEMAQIRRKNSISGDRDRPWIDQSSTGFQLGAVLGCYAMRYGFDKGCRKAELLAIFDSEDQHRRLVRYYRIAGFSAVREVGDDFGDIPDRIVWGGVGTLMKADIAEFIGKWKRIVCVQDKIKESVPNN